ncbi:MAG: acyl carrier protein [Acholeplasmataceae bacterium]|jgi:acyl carrier protein|nr:acyl carrier protein [Acholeplasmataceae bacterium]
MKKEVFLDTIKERLEIESQDIDENTNLKELSEYDSISVMTLIATIDELFGKTFRAKDLVNITTVRSLMELIGMENFE